jgi:hypothetical protein
MMMASEAFLGLEKMYKYGFSNPYWCALRAAASARVALSVCVGFQRGVCD